MRQAQRHDAPGKDALSTEVRTWRQRPRMGKRDAAGAERKQERHEVRDADLSHSQSMIAPGQADTCRAGRVRAHDVWEGYATTVKRLVVVVLALACASPALATQTKQPARQADSPRLAPADEYFGRMKMSPIGIGNEIHDIGLLLKYDPTRYVRLTDRARLTEDALLDWRARYPSDTWLAKDAYLMARVDAMFYDRQSRAHAWNLMEWVARHFPKTPYGANARGEVRRGHVIPLYAMPSTPPTPTPAPTPTATPAATPAP